MCGNRLCNLLGAEAETVNTITTLLATQDKLSLLIWMLSSIIVLGFIHNLLLVGNGVHNPFKRPYRQLLPREGILLYSSFLCLTVILMLLCMPTKTINLAFFLVVVTTTVSTVFIINILHTVLSHLKEDKIRIELIRDENLFLLIFWVLFTEFSFLNYLLRDVPQNYQATFDALATFDTFIFGYTVLLLFLAIYLSFPIKDKKKRVWPQGRRFKIIVLSDPVLIIASILLCSHVAVIAHRYFS